MGPVDGFPADPVRPVPPDEILVGGRWRRGGGDPLVTRDPADGRVLAEIHATGAGDVDEAVCRGHEAVRLTRDALPHERARWLTAIAALIERDAEGLARLQTADTGKSIGETRALVASAAGTFRYFAGVAETLEGALTPPRGPYLTMSTHEPIGVVGAITPWNSPIASDAQKIAPALAAGNAVLLKPAEWTPLVALALGRLVCEAGLPEGLLSVLPGPGPVTGDAIVRHPGVGKVSFTGGTATGRAIGAIAARKIMPVSLELGGKSPTIVLPDADLDLAVAGILFGIFSSSGQSCVAGSRVLLPSAMYDEVLGRLVAGAEKLRVGPGDDPSTQVAPLVTAEHRDRVAAMVDRARADGARVRCGGAPLPGPGNFYPPTILDGLPADSAACQEEIFGPVLVALPYTGEEELVTLANATVYGLACGIWTRDYRAAVRLARRVEAGTVWINTYKQFSVSTPFGGEKESGLGREKGREGVLAYTRQKSLYWGLDERPNPWAGPV
ncbi:aldehyde dehydrogenase [Bailinhaonella thermotolerans]|uniref:Aldehyde dehydrogenase n=2 Tax=Bailinhaonella thermotolerans TaxID=1070861 RepID=A0A3A4AYX4_9ACTN|nr:aldehyde dehydrogenase [Bailinhaonella thermotolerans]